jgi:fluoride exporter
MIMVAVIAMAGGVEAVTRFVLDGLIQRRHSLRFPVETMIINVSGSLLLGYVSGLAIRQLLPEPWHLIIGSGFLGGYTTFSTASVETVRLLQERRWLSGMINGLGMLAVAIAAAAAGLIVGLLE